MEDDAWNRSFPGPSFPSQAWHYFSWTMETYYALIIGHATDLPPSLTDLFPEIKGFMAGLVKQLKEHVGSFYTLRNKVTPYFWKQGEWGCVQQPWYLSNVQNLYETSLDRLVHYGNPFRTGWYKMIYFIQQITKVRWNQVAIDPSWHYAELTHFEVDCKQSTLQTCKATSQLVIRQNGVPWSRSVFPKTKNWESYFKAP